MSSAKKYLVELIERQPEDSSMDEILRTLTMDLVMRRNREAGLADRVERPERRSPWRAALRRH